MRTVSISEVNEKVVYFLPLAQGLATLAFVRLSLHLFRRSCQSQSTMPRRLPHLPTSLRGRCWYWEPA